MMQTAEPLYRYNSAAHSGVACCFTTRRRSLRQRKMSSVIVIIKNVLVHQPFEMTLIHNDDMVKQIAAAVADPALGDAVLPRASETGPLGLDAEALRRVDHFLIELCSAIEDQIARRRVVRKCLAQLLNYPCARWVFGHIAVKDAPPIMRNDEEAIEYTEGERRHSKEIHRGNCFAVIAQERRPPSCRLWIAGCLSHPAQHGLLRNIEAEHLQFTVDARRAPCGVVGDHTEDQLAQFLSHALSSHAVPMPREPRPVEPEPRPVPANDRFRLDEDQGLFPIRPELPQDHPEHLVRSGKPRLKVLLFQNGKLLPKGQVFQEEVAARTTKPNKKIEQELQPTEHEPVVAEAQRISMQSPQHKGCLSALHLHSLIVTQPKDCLPEPTI